MMKYKSMLHYHCHASTHRNVTCV